MLHVQQSHSANQSAFPITSRINENNHLVVGDCDIVTLCEQFGTPLYILDELHIRLACREFINTAQCYAIESKILYASKALSTSSVAAIIRSEQLGIDVMSQGELLTALSADIIACDIYFHGNNKSEDELRAAVTHRCKIVVDNWHELLMLSALTEQLQITNITILIRITPNIESFTHHYIRTGQFDSKFGFNYDEIDDVILTIQKQPRLCLIGIHMHIGSQVSTLTAYQELATIGAKTLNQINMSHRLNLYELNVGGGLAVNYSESEKVPTIKEWVSTILESLIAYCQQHHMKFPKVIFEPGRSIIATSGITAYKAGSQKTINNGISYIAIDGGMSDNPRPITYSATHLVTVANKMNLPRTQQVTIVGKHCESGDVLFKNVSLPHIKANDIIVAAGTGAYNYSQSSNYNRIPRSAMVLVADGNAHLIIERETNEDLMRTDRVPQHLLSSSGNINYK